MTYDPAPALRRSWRWLLVLLLAASPACALAQIKAFPQAEGFGAVSTGGRGGDVYHVTNLNDSGAGSLRYGIDNAPSQGRTIVFDVGGWITVNSKLGIDNHNDKITIAGQTAPGGIGIRGHQFSIGGNDIIVRHMRFRPGKDAGRVDSAGANSDANRVIYDHISAGYSHDENFSVGANDFTLQYSTVSFGLEDHSAGSLIQGPNGVAAGNLSFHHNLYAHNDTRNPKARADLIDWRDNVVYNHHNGFIAGDSDSTVTPHWRANFDGNTYILRQSSNRPMMTGGRTQNYDLWYGLNAMDSDRDSVNDPINYTRAQAMADQSIVSSAYNWFTAPFAAPEVWQSGSPQAAYERVLDEFGATPWDRDAVDQLVHSQVVTRTGARVSHENQLGIENAGYPTLGGVAAPLDSDNDGIPNDWETKHGTNPFSANNNGDFDLDGYTDLEEYLNDLAAFAAIGPLEFSGVGRYADWKRWTNRWEPSRVDEVHIHGGAAFVDAVGQKAGSLHVNGDGSVGGRLYVTSGWLEVTEDLIIGEDLAGRVEQHGGELRVVNGGVDLQSGAYNLRGGVLSTPSLTIAPGADFNWDGGTLAPVIDEVAAMTVTGNLTIESGGLLVDIASATAADLIVVSGDVVLGGVLDVNALGFVPSPGQSWDILTASSLSGSFTSVTPGYSTEIVGNTLRLVRDSSPFGLPAPEPGTAILALIAACGFAIRQRGARAPAVTVLGSVVLALATTTPQCHAVTITLTPQADTFTRSGVGAGSQAVLDTIGFTGESFVSYIRWDLSGLSIGAINDATITFHKTPTIGGGSRNDTYTPGRFANFGLTNQAGNVPQDWNEGSLSEGNWGAEYTDSTQLSVVESQVFNLDADRGADVVEPAFGAVTDVITLTGVDLVSFLNQRLADGGLATIISAVDADGRGWGYGAREDAGSGLVTTLTIDYNAILRGDYNNDGAVDAADYATWRNAMGTSTQLQNEEVSPGVVDIADYLYWRERYGATDPGDPPYNASQAAPEPAGALVLLTAAPLCAWGKCPR